ncbi:radical SAM protein [bacterium]|nr:radical SAM protein [bacterium]
MPDTYRAPDIYVLMNARSVPYGINLELTARCNLGCYHCYHVESSGPELDTAEIKRLFDDLARLGTMEMTITGGEPFLREDIGEIIVYAVETAGFSIKIFSNLTLLKPSLADVLASVPLNSVETTLLGPDAETHDMLARVPGAFTAVMNSIAVLKERGIRVSAKTVLMKHNYKKINAMYELAGRLGIPFRHDDSLFVESGRGRGPLAFQISDSEIHRNRRRMGISGSYKPTLCNAGRSIMSIGPDGSVYPCGAFPEKAGNIRETPVETIWRSSPLMKKLRTLHSGDYGVCTDCRYLMRCQGCLAMGIGLASGRINPCRLARRHFRHLT